MSLILRTVAMTLFLLSELCSAEVSFNDVKALKNIDAEIVFSGDGRFVFDKKENKTLFMSTNGRYVIPSPVIFDTWTGKVLSTIEDVRLSKRLINLKLLGFSIDDLAHFKAGFTNSQEKLLVIIDPTVKQQINGLRKLYQFALADQKALRVMIAPSSTQKLNDIRLIYCGIKDEQKPIQSLLNGTYRKDKECTPDISFMKNIYATLVMGVETLPWAINDNGVVFTSLLQDDPKTLFSQTPNHLD